VRWAGKWTCLRGGRRRRREMVRRLEGRAELPQFRRSCGRIRRDRCDLERQAPQIGGVENRETGTRKGAENQHTPLAPEQITDNDGGVPPRGNNDMHEALQAEASSRSRMAGQRPLGRGTRTESWRTQNFVRGVPLRRGKTETGQQWTRRRGGPQKGWGSKHS
jgi:hypothetical protein